MSDLSRPARTSEPLSSASGPPDGGDAKRPRADGARRVRPVALLAVAVVVVLLGVALARGGGGDPSATPAPSTGPSGQASSGAAPVRGPVTGIERRKAGDPLAVGRRDAPVVMVEYGDFRCPFCGKFARETQPKLVERYVESGVLRIEWRDFAIFGEQSDTAAYAARAAARQGRFWQFHDALYDDASGTGHPDLPTSKLMAAARQAGVRDLSRMKKDMASAALRSEVDADRDEALRIGASSTPAFVINGTPVLGAQPLEAFVSLIDQARGSTR